MNIPTFKSEKFPKEQNTGGLRGYKPQSAKGQGPQAFTGNRFGQGTESPGRPFQVPNISGQGIQRKTGQVRFGQMTPSKDRPYNPATPKRGSEG